MGTYSGVGLCYEEKGKGMGIDTRLPGRLQHTATTAGGMQAGGGRGWEKRGEGRSLGFITCPKPI